jgi:hypothetical protein
MVELHLKKRVLYSLANYAGIMLSFTEREMNSLQEKLMVIA